MRKEEASLTPRPVAGGTLLSSLSFFMKTDQSRSDVDVLLYIAVDDLGWFEWYWIGPPLVVGVGRVEKDCPERGHKRKIAATKKVMGLIPKFDDPSLILFILFFVNKFKVDHYE
jgi:hypothetical protein